MPITGVLHEELVCPAVFLVEDEQDNGADAGEKQKNDWAQPQAHAAL
jgi:hypothetical protein